MREAITGKENVAHFVVQYIEIDNYLFTQSRLIYILNYG